MKRKQFVKGINQIAQEGAIQIFQEFNTGMEEIIVGVVGVLQFDVLKYRLENEYNVDIRLETLPYEHIRWIANKEEVKVDKIVGTSDMKKVTDLKGNPLLLFVNSWECGYDRRQKSGLNINGIQQITLFIYLPIWYNGQRLRDSLGGFSMAEKRTTYKIQDLGGIGEVQIADEVVAIIAGLAATEVDGVASMAGNITNDW